MGRTRGKFTNKVIYIENSGLQPIGGQYLQNVNGILYWNGISIATLPTLAINVSYDNTTSALTATNVQAAIDELDSILDGLSFAASNITYDPSSSGLISTNVQDAIGEVVGLIPTVSYPVTDGENGIYISGTQLRLGTNPLLENTLLNIVGFTFDIASTSNNSRILAQGSDLTLKAATNFYLQTPNIVSATKVANRSLRIVNEATGKLDWTVSGLFAETRTNLSNPLTNNTILTADGLVLNTTTNACIINPTYITNTYFASSKQYSSLVNDFTQNAFGFVCVDPNIGIPKIIEVELVVIPDIDVILTAIPGAQGGGGGGALFNPQYADGLKLITGYGYGHGTYCPAGKETKLVTSMHFTNFCVQLLGITVYRNINGINDATPVILTYKTSLIRFRQIEK